VAPQTAQGKAMNKRLFDVDPLTGIKKYWHVKENGEYAVETVQETGSAFDANRREYNQQSDGKNWRDINKVASIPLAVYYDLKRKGIADDPAALKRWLNDSDNRVFRTRGGML